MIYHAVLVYLSLMHKFEKEGLEAWDVAWQSMCPWANRLGPLGKMDALPEIWQNPWSHLHLIQCILHFLLILVVLTWLLQLVGRTAARWLMKLLHADRSWATRASSRSSAVAGAAAVGWFWEGGCPGQLVAGQIGCKKGLLCWYWPREEERAC